MASDFGDSDPEDAWDPDDPVDVLIDNIRRRVALLVVRRVLDRLDVPDGQRIRMIGDDLTHILERVRNG